MEYAVFQPLTPVTGVRILLGSPAFTWSAA